MSNIRTYSTERCVDWHQKEEGSKYTSTCQGARHRPFTVRTYICISYVYSSSVHFVVQPAKEGTGKRAVVDATCQPVLLYVLTALPPWPRMKAFTMFDEPSAAFASALLFLFSAFDATAAGGGAAGGADCACEASAGAAAVELRLGGVISPTVGTAQWSTVPCASAYPTRPLCPAKPQHSSRERCARGQNKSSSTVVFNSWNCSVVNVPLCLSLPNLAFMHSKAAAFIERAVCARPKQKAGVPAQMVGLFCGSKKRNRHYFSVFVFINFGYADIKSRTFI